MNTETSKKSTSYASQAEELIASLQKDGRTGMVEVETPENRSKYFGYALLPGWTPDDLKKVEQVEKTSNDAIMAGGSMREHFKNTSIILAEAPDCWIGRDTDRDGKSSWVSVDINTGERNSEGRNTLTELVPQVIRQHQANELGWDKVCARRQALEAGVAAQAQRGLGG